MSVYGEISKLEYLLRRTDYTPNNYICYVIFKYSQKCRLQNE